MNSQRQLKGALAVMINKESIVWRRDETATAQLDGNALEAEGKVFKGFAHGDPGYGDLVLAGAAALSGSLFRKDVAQYFHDV